MASMQTIEEAIASQNRKFVSNLPQCLQIGVLDHVTDPAGTRQAGSSKHISSFGSSGSQSTLKLVMGN
jgi:hypothetical protein